ncbi:MAG: hypothetical protein JWM80_3720 [Cyanobacteria bacterium RYN_339]|nr:hypothetical protein [Cyanobacteria bacterium RYN_339]
MMKAIRWVLLLALGGCAHAPLSAPQPLSANSAQAAPSSVRALRKSIKDQLEVRDDIHMVTLGDIEVVPSVIWNLFNFETTMTEEVFGLGSATFHIVGTYDVLTKQATVVDQDQVTNQSR